MLLPFGVGFEHYVLAFWVATPPVNTRSNTGLQAHIRSKKVGSQFGFRLEGFLLASDVAANHVDSDFKQPGNP